MQNLIHSYVKELFAEDMLSGSATPEVTEITEEIAEEIITEETDAAEEALEEITDEMAEDIITEEADVAEEISEDITDQLSEEIIIEETDNISIDIAEDLTEELVTDTPDENEIPMEVFKHSSSLNDDLVTDTPSHSLFKKHRETLDEVDFGNEAETYIVDDNDYKSPRLWSGLNIPIIILIVILSIVIGILCYSIFVVPAGEGVTTGKYLKETFDILFG